MDSQAALSACDAWKKFLAIRDAVGTYQALQTVANQSATTIQKVQSDLLAQIAPLLPSQGNWFTEHENEQFKLTTQELQQATGIIQTFDPRLAPIVVVPHLSQEMRDIDPPGEEAVRDTR